MIKELKLETLKKEFEVSKDRILEIAVLFRTSMEQGLAGNKSSLKMLPSFIGKPSGTEKGIYYSIDFGGTNVRNVKFKLDNGNFIKLEEIKRRLKDTSQGYDITGENVDAEQLFDFFAAGFKSMDKTDDVTRLGHTFSFPSMQKGINDAFLIKWTKEIKVKGVEGNNPNILLKEALVRNSLNIEPVAIINDTVGTLLVASYEDDTADIGTIMGTGHNTCYLEEIHPISGGKMIVNMESGNFNKGLPITKYDIIVDKNSSVPGAQLLEKMVSGYYFGEVINSIIDDFYNVKAIFSKDENSYKKLTQIKLDSLMVENFIMHEDKTCELLDCSINDAKLLKDISEIVIKRAVRLVCATFIGTVLHIDNGNISREHLIAVDGTIYEKMPGVANMIEDTFKEVLADKSKFVKMKLVKDGSGLGAAIAAAIAVSN